MALQFSFEGYERKLAGTMVFFSAEPSIFLKCMLCNMVHLPQVQPVKTEKYWENIT